ncbi:dehydrogenase [Acrocarpospora pleiomorpha]|uniref:Dehydrogenase n=1 Tax=Acrocarpospora pleiomorpha TaxID=90975 RepID=A0A5M3XSI1_9ACTN|nr:SDR family NAD(P)-dependent oxidoreductase [Acrocarpospora pleiomorpha]GES22919.1 dehydrogenase [Acrocarpospora pleiomorpha]
MITLITGGANGIGAAVARRLAADGAKIVIADLDDVAGQELAAGIGGVYVHCDVSVLADNEAAVAAALSTYGGLDLAFLNAGVTSGCGLGEDFDLARYRRAMGVNLDGVVFGVHAALPALTASGGTIVATASMAGIIGVENDPIYAANKHAVVGLVRSLAGQLAPAGVRVQALCPSFADTAIIGEFRELLAELDFPILPVSDVVETFLRMLESDGTGECWFVVPGRDSAPFRFRGVPGPR